MLKHSMRSLVVGCLNLVVVVRVPLRDRLFVVERMGLASRWRLSSAMAVSLAMDLYMKTRMAIVKVKVAEIATTYSTDAASVRLLA